MLTQAHCSSSATDSKVCSLAEAVQRYLHPGDTLFLGGMQHGEPSAAIHEIVRQRIDRLRVVSALTHSVALLLGEGLLEELVFAYLIDLYAKESCLADRARQRGAFPRLSEMSHYSLALALRAGEMGVPFLPTRTQLGTDYVRHHPGLREMSCPFTAQRLLGVQAINPDVGILHTQQCDVHGTAHRWGSLGIDRMGINACRHIIITTERIVSSDVIHRDPNRTIVPGFRVAAVVEVPWGAYPLHLAGCYHSDLGRFARACRTAADYDHFVARYLTGVPDRAAMMARLEEDLGPGFLDHLRADAATPHPPAPEPVFAPASA